MTIGDKKKGIGLTEDDLTDRQHELLDSLLIHEGSDWKTDEQFDSNWLELNKKRIKDIKSQKETLPSKTLINKDAQNLVEKLFSLNKSEETTTEESEKKHKLVSEKYKTYNVAAVKPFSKEQQRSEINRAMREMSVSNPQKLKKILNYRKDLKAWKNGKDLSKKLKIFQSDSELTQILKMEPIPTKIRTLTSILKSRKTSVDKINEQLDSVLQSVLEAAPLYETLVKKIKK
tara:strand:+ start:2836 stop:3528 length:693 start_codon:yes stop_codon:yes gene_type:complete